MPGFYPEPRYSQKNHESKANGLRREVRVNVPYTSSMSLMLVMASAIFSAA
jgi:hypothetical protein